MKLNLKKKILTVNGEQATYRDAEGEVKKLYLRNVLLRLLPVANVQGEQTVTCWDLALRIKKAKKEIELDKDEKKLLTDIVTENSMGKNPRTGQNISAWASFVIGQVLKVFKEEKK